MLVGIAVGRRYESTAELRSGERNYRHGESDGHRGKESGVGKYKEKKNGFYLLWVNWSF